MKALYYSIILIIINISNVSFAKNIYFENNNDLAFFKNINGNNKLKITNSYYKEGNSSMKWNYTKNGIIQYDLENPLILNKEKEDSYGITLWIYNEHPQNDSIRFEFLSTNGNPSYFFTFKLLSKGWRACWISFKYMKGNKNDKTIKSCRIIAPNKKGCVYIDRLVFPEKQINLRTTPDMQMPYNNSFKFRDLWHWCHVWEWEQNNYIFELPKEINSNDKTEIELIEKRLSDIIISDYNKEYINKAYTIFKNTNIQKSGLGFKGSPIVSPDEINRNKNEISWNDIESMLWGFALDAFHNKNKKSYSNYFIVWEYAIDQGFAYGSGMGTNHHYGYQVRNIYNSAWLMKDAIFKNKNCNNIISTLSFWAALQETRQPCNKYRDELLDSWHTLLIPKVISALIQTDIRKRYQELKGISNWLSTSLRFTSGTIGGIKIDGTTFHHGGFYPAYTVGSLGAIGTYINLTINTQFIPNKNSLLVFRKALETLRNCCNKYEWGIGIGGRHPFSGSLKESDINSFAYLALSGDLSDQGNSFDHNLASEFLRLSSKETKEKKFFQDNGIKTSKSPNGFFVYNYGSTGIFRNDNWIVTLKGYNTDVWGAEIYKANNRYGRYQSYGSAQIMTAETREESGYKEEGWDWNRLPGTTTIHLPFELLDSPLPGTTMAKSKEKFAGCSTLDGMNGVFAIKLMERNLKNFTPDFVAKKTFFCFDNRMICLGTNISNSNNLYNTETTLFQTAIQKNKSSISINGKEYDNTELIEPCIANNNNIISLKDNYDNLYLIRNGETHVKISEQESFDNKTKRKTKGKFATAWINHGKNPQGEMYEYIVLIQPKEQIINNKKIIDSYNVLKCDSIAHIVKDNISNTIAYVAFETTNLSKDSIFKTIPSETIIICKPSNNGYEFSVCDPNLNIPEKAFTTKEESRIIEKRIVLNNKWKIISEINKTKVSYINNQTVINVSCQHGQPVKIKATSDL